MTLIVPKGELLAAALRYRQNKPKLKVISSKLTSDQPHDLDLIANLIDISKKECRDNS
ncbi:MAG: hypothetical protein ACK51W_22105 [Aphanizomenon sp.]|jgi:hypothetical protein|nr:hypothetical protein [Aphanizomenon flos-aquae UKL13-PB]MBO1061098.1 hypothetical protein [Aphanizomenon flos-aquae CP01]